jgi:hypothetical protein
MIKLLIIKSGLGFYQGDEFSMETSKATKLIELGIAKEITILKAPKEPLIELESEIDINTQTETKKPTKRTKSTKK